MNCKVLKRCEWLILTIHPQVYITDNGFVFCSLSTVTCGREDERQVREEAWKKADDADPGSATALRGPVQAVSPFPGWNNRGGVWEKESGSPAVRDTSVPSIKRLRACADCTSWVHEVSVA